MEISLSILGIKDIKKAVKLVNDTNTDYLHLDVMDGVFVNNKAYDVEQIKYVINNSNKKIDAHFMVNNPMYYLESLKGYNLEYFTFHLEVDDVINIIKKAKENGYKVGVSIKPNTNINDLKKYIDYVDMVLIMSVEPGMGGQSYIRNTENRIRDVKTMIGNKNIKISVDGGINNETIKLIKDSDIAVVGSYITNSDDFQERINLLRR